MTTGPLLKASFAFLAANQPQAKTLPLQINPETLTRTLRCAPLTGTAPPTALTDEVITFTAVLDAAQLTGSANPGAAALIVESFEAAADLLAYYQDTAANEVTVFRLGDRVIPVRVLELQVIEQAFDAALHPLRAEIHISLQVLNRDDLCHSERAKALWHAFLTYKQALAERAYGFR